jgi:hypothetical protein
MIEDYINSYIESKIIITGNNDDYILSCHMKYDLDVSYQSISKTLLKNKSIKKKIMKGSMYYIGLKYK